MASALSWGAQTRADGGSVYVNDQLVLTLRSGSSRERASRSGYVANRLRPLNAESVVSVDRQGKTVRLVSGTYVVMNVIRAEASAHGTTVTALADRWAASLRKALQIPPIELSEADRAVGVGRGLTVALKGSEAAKAKISVDASEVVEVSRISEGIRLVGKSLGEAYVTVTSPSVETGFTVRVLPLAAGFPQSVSAAVTGEPASAETVREAIRGAIRLRAKRFEGADLSFEVPPVASLSFDGALMVPIKVRATHPDAADAEGVVNVTVNNLAIAHRREEELWYCNDPENVRQPGKLFAGRLQVSHPVRLLYHHINESGAGLYLTVWLSNAGDEPARVVIIPGDSPPDKNPVLAGYLAAEQFVRLWMRGSGEVVTIPPRSQMPLSSRRLAPRETMSGLAYLRLLDGGPEAVTVTTEARSPYDDTVAPLRTVASATPWNEALPVPAAAQAPLNAWSEHVYPHPFKEETARYEVGGKYAFVRIGQRPIGRADGLKSLDGNFGVLYSIQARLENPTDLAADVEVVFEASAGYTGGLFIVNGELRRSKLLQPKEEATLLSTRINPRSFQDVRIMTVPLSGSSYPATITIRPVEYAASRSNRGR